MSKLVGSLELDVVLDHLDHAENMSATALAEVLRLMAGKTQRPFKILSVTAEQGLYKARVELDWNGHPYTVSIED